MVEGIRKLEDGTYHVDCLHFTLKAMRKSNIEFVRRLADLWDVASPDESRILRDSFPEIYKLNSIRGFELEKEVIAELEMEAEQAQEEADAERDAKIDYQHQDQGEY